MSLGENISALRKKQGWSQEELALKLEVTRQSVSKWESDQSVPDLERIIAISRLFGVSTDALLLAEPAATATDAPQLRRLTLADAEAYLQLRRRHAPQLARATFACITCAVPLMLLGALTEWRDLPESSIGGGAGVIILLLLIAWAVSRYINCDGELRPLQYIEREEFIADAAVIALAEDTLIRENERITAGERRGTTCCILCPVPLLVAAFLQAGDVVLALCTCLLLVLVGIGVGQLIRAGELEEAAQALLQTADYTPQRKREKPAMEAFSGGYWLLATAIFLILGFRTDLWRDAAIVTWPLAGLLFVPCRMLFRALLRRFNK